MSLCSKIYAVDPLLNLREHSKYVIEIKDYVENVPDSIEYDSVSILFVPWDNSFFNIIKVECIVYDLETWDKSIILIYFYLVAHPSCIAIQTKGRILYL